MDHFSIFTGSYIGRNFGKYNTSDFNMPKKEQSDWYRVYRIVGYI